MASMSILACGSGMASLLASSSKRQPQLANRATVTIKRPERRLQAVKAASEKNGNGSSSASPVASHEQQQTIQMVNLVHQYFDEFMSKGDMEVAHKVLESHAMHKDMVRDLGYSGVREIQDYVSKLKQDFPELYVKATQFGVANTHTMFVAFEGRASNKTPAFKGVDLFCFNDRATKIKEIQVYRSAWVGAKGHEDRKRTAQATGHLVT